jgi:hypothetical protein
MNQPTTAATKYTNPPMAAAASKLKLRTMAVPSPAPICKPRDVGLAVEVGTSRRRPPPRERQNRLPPARSASHMTCAGRAAPA